MEIITISVMEEFFWETDQTICLIPANSDIIH